MVPDNILCKTFSWEHNIVLSLVPGNIVKAIFLTKHLEDEAPPAESALVTEDGNATHVIACNKYPATLVLICT